MKVEGSYYDASHVLYDYSADGYQVVLDPYDDNFNSSSYDYSTEPDNYYNTTYNYYYYAQYDPESMDKTNSTEVVNGTDYNTYNYNYHYYDTYKNTSDDKDDSFLGKEENNKPKDESNENKGDDQPKKDEQEKHQ